jgi:hypothetical protein
MRRWSTSSNGGLAEERTLPSWSSSHQVERPREGTDHWSSGHDRLALIIVLDHSPDRPPRHRAGFCSDAKALASVSKVLPDFALRGARTPWEKILPLPLGISEESRIWR